MIKRSITQLTVYEIEKEVDSIPFECLRKLYLEKTSEIIYITKSKKLYGIVGMGEVLRNHRLNEEIKINKNYTYLEGYNIIKAHDIFHRRQYVHAIPVVNEENELIGDYLCWDDALYFERNSEYFIKEDLLRSVLEPYKAVFLVEPVDKQNLNYVCMMKYLEQCHIDYSIVNKKQINLNILEKVIFIFLDENERRGIQCLYGLEPCVKDCYGLDILKYDVFADKKCRTRFATYKSLLHQINEESQERRLGICKPDHVYYDRIDEKATVLLTAIKQKGIRCFCLYSEKYEEDALTEYYKNLKKEMYERVVLYPRDPRAPWPKINENKGFFDELYNQEDYQKEKAQKEFVHSLNAFQYKDEITQQYCNAKDGRRVTCFQPQDYIGTIYILGPCTILGVYVEDQYTVSSYLQKRLLEKGYIYKVENYGDMSKPDSAIDSCLEKIEKLNASDIVIYQSSEGVQPVGIQGISLEEISERHHIPSSCFMERLSHCNHKVNQFIAESILEMIEPCLNKQIIKNKGWDSQIGVKKIMKGYIQQKYLEPHFSCLKNKAYKTVGAIVMKCDPFSKGHRYLIEQALSVVEFLIIFLINADSACFSFEERFKLVKEGTRDISNIMIVPNGDFILSQKQFPQYFSGFDNRAAISNAEYDINIFSDYIAEALNITHRFAGEEDKKEVVRKYQEIMKRILPQKGITYIEVPRFQVGGGIVYTSQIRNYLRKKEYSRAFDLVVDTTRQYIKDSQESEA